MPRKKQTEEVKLDKQIDETVDKIIDSPAVNKVLDEICDTVIGETVDELSSPKVIPEIAILPSELEQKVDTIIDTSISNESAGASIITPEIVEVVKEVETLTVDKKALYRLIQALNRNQVHMYIGTAATRFLGELFYLPTLIERVSKWEEVKKWNAENPK